ncbi:hypothetical protein FOHLNKBM_4361 [Methylobacterium longum]|nr:hypothetical protein FOHLNKBM_4361 [Methylobacterium longum]
MTKFKKAEREIDTLLESVRSSKRVLQDPSLFNPTGA